MKINNMIYTYILFLTFSFSVNLFAGGSAQQSEILELLPPETVTKVTHNYSLYEEGLCLRVGRHLPNGGEKILPCSIFATSKEDGKLYELYFDENGEVYPELVP